MSIAFEITEKEAMSMAVVFENDEEKANEMLEDFLTDNGIVETKRFFLQISSTRRGVRTVGYLKFAVVPEGTSKKGKIDVSNIPALKYLSVTVDADIFDSFVDGDFQNLINDFLKEKSYKIDISKTMPFGEIIDSGQYRFFTPIK